MINKKKLVADAVKKLYGGNALVTDDGVYIEKGGAWVPVDAAEASAIASEVTALELPAIKEAKIEEIRIGFERAVGVLIASYPQVERESWAQQEKEARAYIADSTAVTPLIDAISAARGVTKDALAQKIVVKADTFASAVGALIGKRQALEDAINAATTIAELEAVKW